MASRNRAQLKRFASLLISIVFHALARLWKGIRGLVTRDGPGTCVVLYYHAVRAENRAQFARQMDILLRCARPTRVDRKEPLKPAVHYAAVTFDDGYQNVIENALPELKKRNIPSTMFIITEALGKYPHWLTDFQDAALHESVMSAAQLRELPPDLVTVGSHTLTHPALPALNENDAKRELSESRVKLEKMLNKKITLFSFPYGAFNAKLIKWCRESGYERVFTILPTLAFSDPEEFVTGRVRVDPTDWPLEFRLKLMGAYRWLPGALSMKRKVSSISLLSITQKRKAEVGI